MTTRKRRKKPAPKRSNSQIAAAQREAAKAQRKFRETEPASKVEVKGGPASANDVRPGAARPGPAVPGGTSAGIGTERGKSREQIASDKAGPSMSEAANKVAGLASGIMEQRSKERKLADPKLYGGTSDKQIRDRLIAQQNAIIETKNRKLKDAGGAVYLGTTKHQVRRAQRGGDFEGGTNRIPESIDVEDIRSKDELMSWLADEKTFNQIKAAAEKAGIGVQSYDDVAKIWKSVVDQAAAAYSSVGKKVSPWELLTLRGKTMVNGRPAARTTTSTTIDEMDPAEAKLMIKNAAANALGRDPTKAEIEDFIAKAQTIARANPSVTKTTTQFDFAGDPTNQTSTTTGGGDAVTAQAQLAAEEQLKQSEDYTSYQGAGVIMPWLNEALASPF